MFVCSVWRGLLASALLGFTVGCASEPPGPARDPFLVEIEAAEQAMDEHSLASARPRLDAALAIASVRGRQSVEQGRAHLGLARWHRLDGDPRKAVHHLGLARFATRAALGSESLETADVEFESSLQQQAAGSHDQAVDSMREALRIRETHLPAETPAIAVTLTALGLADLRGAQYRDAVRVIGRALAALERWPVADERAHLLLTNRNRLTWLYARAALADKADEQRILAHGISFLDGGAGGDTPKLEVGLAGLAEETNTEREEMRALERFAEDWVRNRRIAEEHFSFEHLMLSTRARLDRGASPVNTKNALEADLMTAFLSFAPAGAKPRSGELYQLPFAGPIARRVAPEGQAHGYEHAYLHGVDFEMPPGSLVSAARAGVVTRVISGFSPETARATGRNGDPSHGDQVNRVMILHEDGTYASYFPLAQGIHVFEGLEVEAGDALGETATAPSGTPILHFDVRRNIRSSGKLLAEPVRCAFQGVAEREGVPLAGHFYGGESPPPAARDDRLR